MNILMMVYLQKRLTKSFSKGYLANNDKVPTIYDAATVTSIKNTRYLKAQKIIQT